MIDLIKQHLSSSGLGHLTDRIVELARPAVQLDCQLASNGLYCGDSSGYDDPRAASLRTDAGQWRLLFQLGSDENAEMMWGDLGRLYFWMTESALKDRQFQKCWMTLQCF